MPATENNSYRIAGTGKSKASLPYIRDVPPFVVFLTRGHPTLKATIMYLKNNNVYDYFIKNTIQARLTFY